MDDNRRIPDHQQALQQADGRAFESHHESSFLFENNNFTPQVLSSHEGHSEVTAGLQVANVSNKSHETSAASQFLNLEHLYPHHQHRHLDVNPNSSFFYPQYNSSRVFANHHSNFPPNYNPQHNLPCTTPGINAQAQVSHTFNRFRHFAFEEEFVQQDTLTAARPFNFLEHVPQHMADFQQRDMQEHNQHSQQTMVQQQQPHQSKHHDDRTVGLQAHQDASISTTLMSEESTPPSPNPANGSPGTSPISCNDKPEAPREDVNNDQLQEKVGVKLDRTKAPNKRSLSPSSTSSPTNSTSCVFESKGCQVSSKTPLRCEKIPSTTESDDVPLTIITTELENECKSESKDAVIGLPPKSSLDHLSRGIATELRATIRNKSSSIFPRRQLSLRGNEALCSEGKFFVDISHYSALVIIY